MYGLLSKSKDSNEVCISTLMHEPKSILGGEQRKGLENKSLFHYSMQEQFSCRSKIIFLIVTI